MENERERERRTVPSLSLTPTRVQTHLHQPRFSILVRKGGGEKKDLQQGTIENDLNNNDNKGRTTAKSRKKKKWTAAEGRRLSNPHIHTHTN